MTVNVTLASRGLLAYLVLTAVLCGALVMVIEVLGSRVIGPFFGVSLYVWTSLISVTLVSLAGGYAVGGMLADRFPSPAYLYAIILVAGLLALAVPAIKGPVLAACVPLGLRGGALAGTLILFGPALFALGCVTPYILRVAVRELDNLGRAAGGFYALSTVGSVLGTLATGFVLIGSLGVTDTFRLTAGLLIALGCGYFLLFRRRWAVSLALVVPFVPLADPPAEARMDDGTRVSLVAAHDSFYGELKVVEYRYGALHTRELLIDGLVQGGMDVRSGLPVYGSTYFLQRLPYAINPGGERALVIGLGAGLVPRWYEARGVVADVVDIDAAVAELARAHFGYRGRGELFVADARSFLAHPGRRYDYIIVDVFNGDTTPGHLMSLEALRLAKARLAPRGVLAFNLVGSLRRRPFMTASVVATLEAVFDQAQVFPTFPVDGGGGDGNLTLVAYDGEPRPVPVVLLSPESVHPLAGRTMPPGPLSAFRFPAGTPAMLLTDDFNPMDVHDAGLREAVRRNILETTDWGILLG